MKPTAQMLTDLIQLHGWVKDREGLTHYALPVAMATRALFPEATLSQAMQQTFAQAIGDDR